MYQLDYYPSNANLAPHMLLEEAAPCAGANMGDVSP